jgi:signal transduction histidine kinase
MLHCSKTIRTHHQFKLTATTFFLLLIIISCGKKNTAADDYLKKQYQSTDSLFVAAKTDTALQLLEKARLQTANNSPLITTYYYLKASHADDGTIGGSGAVKMNLYADSAVAFFTKNDSRIKWYPNEYFQTMLIKGEACIRAKKYISALNYYYNAKKIQSSTNCDNGLLTQKMAYIFYAQKKYALAAKYWAESGRKLDNCHEKYSPQRLFFMRQSSYNNAGFAFFKSGQNDSARYFLLEDLKITDKADKDSLIGKVYIDGARAVVYDNLAGIALAKGDLKAAQQMLDKCFAMPIKEVNGLRIPPYIKLVKINMQLGNSAGAEVAFKHARALLDLYYKANPDLNIEWNHLYAEYLLKQKRPFEAYKYQKDYIRIKDSVYASSLSLFQLDIDRELSTINQQQSFVDLQHRNQSKKIYLGGIGIIVLLCMVIMVMTILNLKKTQRNHKETTIHNQQLHITLDELERVNKNYIRIMRVMAHDLRNPLSGMTGLATMLLGEDEFSEESRHMLKLIETTGIYSMEMISELLKSGLADENEIIEKQNLDLKALLYDSVELLQFKAKEKDQEIIFESDSTPIMANVNHEKIWRVFNNLIVNAVKFSHEGGIIHVNIKAQNAQVLISIADSGIGISESEKESIFEMFTPAKKFGTSGEQPFGLGLSISKRIIEKHKGRIWFESQPGIGTIFYLSLPMAG